MGILSGIRVVDFTAAAAGPYGTMLLGDLGAEVIKVESPSGSNGRKWGTWHRDGKSALFFAVNRNKKSVVIDLTDEGGQQKASQLVATADVVVESFAPGGAERFGLTYDACKRDNPTLIYCSVSGFGRTGPQSEELGMDMLLQAYSGIMSYTGEPGRPPIRIAISAIDLMTGSMAFGGILAALRHRDETGRGQYLEVSLYDTAINMLAWEIPRYTATGDEPQKLGGSFAHLAPYGIYRTADDYIFVGVGAPKHWSRFCEALDAPGLASDDRFRTNEDRLNNREALDSALEEVMSTYEADDLVRRLKDAGVLASTIRSVGEAIEDEHASAREATRSLPSYPDVRVATPPLKLSEGFIDQWQDPPDLGADTDEYFS